MKITLWIITVFLFLGFAVYWLFLRESPISIQFCSRVTHYYANYYVVEYSFNGGLTWNPLTHAICDADYRSLSERDFPEITRDLQHAIGIAKWLTSERVDSINHAEDQKWWHFLHGYDTTITFCE